MIIYKTEKFNFSKTEDRVFDQFFVWKSKNVYIMDNHRAALWCWMNEVKADPEINLRVLHIDNHPDMSPRGLHCNCAVDLDFKELTLEQYLEIQHNCEQYGHAQIFSYENFLRFFVQANSKNIKPTDVFITLPQWEIKPKINPSITASLEKHFGKVAAGTDCSQLAKRLYKEDLFELLKKDEHPKWIVDLDLDYFYNEATNELNTELAEAVIKQLKEWYDKKKIVALTVAWSPEFLINREKETILFGLEQAKKLNSILTSVFNLYFPEL